MNERNILTVVNLFEVDRGLGANKDQITRKRHQNINLFAVFDDGSTTN